MKNRVVVAASLFTLFLPLTSQAVICRSGPSPRQVEVDGVILHGIAPILGLTDIKSQSAIRPNIHVAAEFLELGSASAREHVGALEYEKKHLDSLAKAVHDWMGQEQSKFSAHQFGGYSGSTGMMEEMKYIQSLRENLSTLRELVSKGPDSRCDGPYLVQGPFRYVYGKQYPSEGEMLPVYDATIAMMIKGLDLFEARIKLSGWESKILENPAW